jgi:putative inorganic carbon (HCO3(-)) transporter
MNEPEILLTYRPKKSGNALLNWLRKKIVIEKLNNVLGFLILTISGVAIALYTSFAGFNMAVILLVMLVAIPSVYITIVYPQFGILVILAYSYFLFAVIRLGINFPSGTLLDGIEGLLILGMFIRQKRKKDWSMVKGPVSIMIVVWIVYNIYQALNPVAESQMAWLYTIRSVAFVMLLYFVFLVQIRTIKYIRTLLKVWLFLSLLVALYGFKQQFIGFSASENEFLLSDPAIADLLFIDGQWRKFSFLSDPVVFSYTMVISSILCICLISLVKQVWKKIILILLTILFIGGMLFSGTRGAYVLIPAAMFFYGVLNFNRKVLAFIAVGGMGVLFFILVPTSNPTIYRFQTAFKPSNDASFNLRRINQLKIRPYILTHPFFSARQRLCARGRRTWLGRTVAILYPHVRNIENGDR